MEKDEECLIYKSIMEEAETGIVILDANSMEVLYANPVAAEYGLAGHDNYAGLTCYEYLAGEEKPCKNCVMEQVLKYGFADRVKVVRKTGRSYYSRFKIMEWNGRKTVAVYITDTTGARLGEQEKQHSERLLSQVIEDANILCWEYDFEHEMLKNENQVLLNAGYVENPYNICETQIADGFIAEESQAQYRRMFQEMRQGKNTVSGEIWFNRNRNCNDKHCIRISYTVECDLDGHPVSATGLGMDITETKNREILHQKQIDALIRTYPDALGSYKMNLTEDYVLDQKTLYNFIPKQGERLRIEAYLKGVGAWLTEKDHKKYMQLFSRENLIESYQNGQQQVELVHQFRFTDRTRWIRTTVRILPNPVTNQLEGYVFAVDISERVLTKQVIDKLISLRYDLLALIYPEEGIVDFRYSGNEYENIPEISIEQYDKNRVAAAKIYGEDQENEYIECTDLNKIQEELDKNGKYSFTLHRYLDNQKHYKRFSYNYLTDTHDVILATIQDTTTLYEKEEAQLKTIQAALNEAERANASKTAFLSNMSHDIRTPMNAIINMAKMAEEDIHDTEKALDDLHKISVSSDFLLSLINDVLDMAKIDSGKMELHPEVYEYQDFINYIESIFTPLCKNKDIQFICKHLKLRT